MELSKNEIAKESSETKTTRVCLHVLCINRKIKQKKTGKSSRGCHGLRLSHDVCFALPCEQHLPLPAGLGISVRLHLHRALCSTDGEVTHIKDPPGSVAALRPLGESGRGQPEPRVSHGSRPWPGERRGLPGTRPAFPFFTPSLAPQIASKEVSQSNFLPLGFVVLQASNCRRPRETQRTSLSYPLSSLDTSGWKHLPQPRGPVMPAAFPGERGTPGPGTPLATAPPEPPSALGSLFLPGPRG